ncbi:MAG: tRNA (N6-isopentenyl adenosine(37)-C2)-methylthiotransferase MiaB [Verrucomicrobiota bacterium]
MSETCAPIDVCAAVVRRGPLVLLAQRPEGKHLAGLWEFPGGKVHDGEDWHTCIRREMLEELGLQVKPVKHLLSVNHTYPEKTIRLHCIECTIDNEAKPVHHEGQTTRWTPVNSIEAEHLAPADQTVAEWLKTQNVKRDNQRAAISDPASNQSDQADTRDLNAKTRTHMPPASYHIRTYGCQMNERDSEALACLLQRQGLVEADAEDQADLLIFNTCSVREQAERKAIGKVQLMKRLKRQRPDIIIGIIGCMAQNHGDSLLDQIPHLDFVLGTDQLHRLPDVLRQLESAPTRTPVALTDTGTDILDNLGGHPDHATQAMVPVMRGCDRFCTYCIVPHVRGREKSRPPADIVAEVHSLADRGVREILLLGQNITAYGVAEERKRNGRWSGVSHFARLLQQLNAVEGLQRIRFTSPHVRYMTDDFIDAVVDLPKVCESVHIPMQSGSNPILKAMHRGYTAEQFRERALKLREKCPQITFSTDIIVGFPGETEEDFRATVQLMRDIGFDMAYIFRYSARPGTAAEKLADNVPPKTKEQRNQHLLQELETYNTANNPRFEQHTVEILVEGPSKRNPERWTGRTRTNKVCIFEPDAECEPGQLRPLTVARTTPSSLFGKLQPPGTPVNRL